MPSIGVRGWITAAVVFAVAFLIWDLMAGAISSLLLLFTAILLSAGLRPMVDRMSKRMPFGAAVGIAFGAVMLLAGLVAFLLIQPLGAELVRLIQAVPGYAASLQDQLTAAQRYIESDQTARQLATQLANVAGTAVTAVGQRLLGGPQLIAATIGDALLIVLLAVGWMLSSDDLERFVLSLMPPKVRDDWRDAFNEIGTRLSAYVKGVVLNGGLVGAVMTIGLAALGVPYALLLGVVSAVFQAIPMLGAVISGPIVLLVVLATNGWTKMLIALVIFVVVQIVDQNVVSPIIFGARVHLSFLLIILATVIGGTLFGIGGAFLAVPAAAVIQVLIVQIVAPAIRRANGTEEAQ